MSDLLYDINRKQQQCSNCGAYRAESMAERQAAAELAVMLDRMRTWQQELWSKD